MDLWKKGGGEGTGKKEGVQAVGGVEGRRLQLELSCEQG